MALFGPRTWPSDERLRADEATANRWRSVLRAERIRTPTAAVLRGLRRIGGRTIATVTGRERQQSRDRHQRERPTEQTNRTWAGYAELAVRPTSPGYLTKVAALHRRVPVNVLAGLLDGWLRLDEGELVWFATRRSGPTEAVVIDMDDLATIELADLGRSRAGLTITTSDTEELWLLLRDRKKVDGILSRLRYGS